jgi:hypothetical protein
MKVPLLIFSLLSGLFMHAQNTPLVVIGNGATGKMSLTDLKSVFKSEKVMWNNASLALMKSTTEPGKSTCSKIYSMSCNDVTKFWVSKAFEGKSATFFNSVGELQAFVAVTPGAIGIIDQSAPIRGVHVILIDGKGSF